MTAVQLSMKLTSDQEAQGNIDFSDIHNVQLEIRRSSRAKTPSLLYSEEFEEKPWVTQFSKKSPLIHPR